MAIKMKPVLKARAPKKITMNDLAVMVQNGFNSIHSEIDTRFSRLESRVENIEARIDNLDAKFDTLQGAVINDHGNRLNAVESDVLNVKIALQNK